MKDRAKPFDRKHVRIWLTVTGSMIVIMSINVGLGIGVMQCEATPPPTPDYRAIPPMIDPPDAALAPAAPVDAGAAPVDVGAADGSLPDDVER